MPDLEITQLTADTAPAGADLLTSVKSPFGAGSNRKITVADFMQKQTINWKTTGALLIGPLADPTTFFAYNQFVFPITGPIHPGDPYVETMGIEADILLSADNPSLSISTMEIDAITDPTNIHTFDQLIGLALILQHDGSGNIGDAWAGAHSAHNVGAANVQALRTGNFVYANLGAGLVTDAAAIYIENPNNDGSNNNITNAYGLYIEDQSKGTNKWAIRTGLGKVELGDDLWLTATQHSTQYFNAPGNFINPITGVAPAGVYGRIDNDDAFKGGDGSGGGLAITGIGADYALQINAYDTDDAEADGNPKMIFNVAKWNGVTGLASVNNLEDAFMFSNNGSPLVTILGSGQIDAHKGGIITTSSIANVSTPPTQAELVSSFGTAANAGAGFVATVNDNNANTAQYIVVGNGTSYWYGVLMKAL